MTKVLVIGAGPAGLAATNTLVKNGISVNLVEKKGILGGQWQSYGCKATDGTCNVCNVCLPFGEIEALLDNELVDVYLNSEIKEIEGKPGDFKVKIQQQAMPVAADDCIACGKCLESCNNGAVTACDDRTYPQYYTIDKNKCSEGCHECEDVCPTGAIDLGSNTKDMEEDYDAVIVATGSKAFDPKVSAWGYSMQPGMISAAQLEQEIKDDKVPSLDSAAFIQCVGSRNQRGNNYCSRVCCLYALRMALWLKTEEKISDCAIYYMDLQLPTRQVQELYQKCLRAGVRFVRGIPSEIRPSAAGLTLRAEDLNTQEINESTYQRVILSVGLDSAASNADSLGLETNNDGFFAAVDGNEGNYSSREGIFLAGTTQAPRDIAASINHGQQAAVQVIDVLRGRVEHVG
ncbi:FAD-dependent oxidoreductase [Metallumcola ferriviriculae]|uniref:FAD-dependent oxidoreductase n=1 Tax=Metallumcola ferriviriculae TaxID=3039180 RepID=A0AAU0UQB1_9FIRM|nr:FAD-dependent oxidoreductase [Desulfitibacteraceae bacterium MK1]